MNTKFYGFYVDPELLKQFKDVSKIDERSAAAQIRKLMQDFIDNKKREVIDENKIV